MTGVIGLISLIGLISHIPEAHASGLIKPSNNLGLVGYWSFEDATGTKATDFSGKGKDGILGNIATNGWSSGKFGKAIDFPFIDNYYVLLPGNLFASNVLTVSLWAKFDTMNIDGTLFGSGDNSSAEDNMTISVSTGSNRLWGGNWDFKAISSVDSISVGPWYHVVLTSNGSTTTLYINGVANGTTGTTLYSSLGNPASIGARSDGLYPFDGKIDDVRIYNRALSPTEVAALYNSGGIAKSNSSLNNFMTNGLVGLWSFDGADVYGTTVYDRSGRGNNASFSGTPRKIRGKIGQALYFDGNSAYLNVIQNSGLPVYNTSTPYSVAFWMKGVDASSAAIFTEGSVNAIFYFRNSSGKLLVNITNDDFATQLGVTSTDTVFDDKWHHVVWTDFAGAGKLYVDGARDIKDFSYTPSGSFTMNTERIAMKNSPFEGILDDIRLYNRALSATEVAQLYRAGTATVNKSSAGINAGLVLWHTFDGSKLNTTTSTDSVNTAYNGTLAGAAGLQNKPQPVRGKIGQALNFDGTDDGIIAPLNLSATNKITVAFWLKWDTNSADGDQALELTTQFDSAGNGFIIQPNAAGNRFEVFMGLAGIESLNGGYITSRPSAGEWHHYIISIDRSTNLSGISAYVDGESVGFTYTSNELMISTFANSNLYIMSRAGSSRFGAGSLDDLRIYNRLLSATEAKLLYNSVK